MNLLFELQLKSQNIVKLFKAQNFYSMDRRIISQFTIINHW